MNVILLDADQAAAVRGASSVHAAARLEPIALTDGRFYLGVGVLNDSMHATHHELLGACPQVAFADIEDLLPQDDHGGS